MRPSSSGRPRSSTIAAYRIVASTCGGIASGAHRDRPEKPPWREALLQQGDEFCVVFDEKHPHRRAPPIRVQLIVTAI